MEAWIKVTLFLCLFGTLREIRPSEPFVSEFLLGPWRNVTEEQLNRDVYPVATYSYLALLVVVFLITDFLRFKPVIVLSGLSGIAVYAILLWTTSIEWLQVSQFLFGLYLATEVAYLTYIYAKVDPAKYPSVSSYTRIAALFGRFLSGVAAQLLTYFDLMDYRDLNYITFTAQILATFWAFWLPAVQFGIYFHRRGTPLRSGQLGITGLDQVDQNQKLPQATVQSKSSFSSNAKEAATLIYKHARTAYTRPKVVVWSALYAVSLALFLQVQTYVQLLWREIQLASDYPVAYNGAVEATLTLLGAGGAFVASVVEKSWLPAPVAAVQGLAVFAATHFPNIFVSYAGYIVMGMLFHYTITLASSKIARQLSDESCFGLIFGINTLVGTALQSILIVVLIQRLTLPIASQFYSVSGLYFLAASAWLLGWLVNTCQQKKTVNLIETTVTGQIVDGNAGNAKNNQKF